MTRQTKTGSLSRIALMLTAVLSVVVFVSGATAQDCEIPLFVKQTLVGANVMILADNSGSMNQAVYHLDYDPDQYYSGNFNNGSTYYISRDRTLTPNSFNWSWPSTPSANLVDSDNGQDGRYPGNYLNWIYFHATDEQRASLPEVTRIQVLKEVLDQIIDRSARLDFGLTVFQYDHGGSVIGKCGVSHTSLRAQIAGITANTWTPLGESMETVLDYFAYDGPDAAIQVPCQYNFCLVVTDGLPTMDLDVSSYLHDADDDGNDPGSCASIGSTYPSYNDCSDHFDDVAYYMAHEDLRPDMEGDQIVYTYVVGFHESGQILQDAAINGDGLFFPAENAVELFESIEYAIQDILRRISAGSAVAVVSTERGTDDRLYRGKFMPIDWDGYLECYALPYNDGDHAIWEAGEILNDDPPSSRKIFTALGDTRYTYTDGQAANLRVAMNVSTDEEAADIINWSRGEDVAGYRDRQGWFLGDIVHSTPVVVGPPSTFIDTESYQAFRDAHQNRDKVVYVGANDGMLHAFDAEQGYERWAFVPEFALPDIPTLADSGYCHVYTCDQTVTVSDVLIGGNWRTVLLSGGREGGSSIFALDVTDPASPTVMWQKDLPNGMAYASEVEIVSIGGVPMALVGSGLDETYGEAWLYAYDVSSGSLEKDIRLSDINDRNKASTPAVVDLNLDGNVDLIYVADLNGSIWRIEIDGGSWDVSELYSGNENITAPPVAAYAEDGAVYVYFGTGAYLTEDDMMTDDQHYFNCVFDHHNGITADRRDLEDQTDSITSVDGSDGWYVELWNKEGERVTEQAVVVAETVIFTSFAPTMDACVAGGESWLYQIRYDTGGLPDSDDMDEESDRSVSLGEGIASYPVVDLSEGTVVVQSSDASISVETIAGLYQRMTVRSWQETYDHVDEETYGGQTIEGGDIQ